MDISDRINLIVKVFVVGYSERGESIIVLFLDKGRDNELLYSIVIDCFKYKGINKTIDILDDYKIKESKIDMLVWSHPDYDHTFGINEILNFYCDENTNVVLPYDLNGEAWNKVKYNKDDKKIVDKILALTKRKFLSHDSIAVNKDSYSPLAPLIFEDLMGKLPVYINALTPHGSRINNFLENHAEIKKNDLSISLCIEVGEICKYRLLLMGDTELDEINLIYEDCFDSPIFIKIPHHTSPTSANLLDRIDIDDVPYVACTTVYKIQKLPNKDLLENYMSRCEQVDCTGFHKGKSKNHGYLEYTFDFYGDKTITVKHGGHAKKVDDTFLSKLPYANN